MIVCVATQELASQTWRATIFVPPILKIVVNEGPLPDEGDGSPVIGSN